MSKKFFVALAAVASFAMPANAALVVDNIGGTSSIAGIGNDFAGDLAGLSLTTYATSYDVGVTGAPVNISVYRVASESGLTNWVQVNATNAFPENEDTWDLGDILITYTQAGDGPLSGNINFLSGGNGLGGGGAPLGGGQVAVFLPANTGTSYQADELFFGFNDNGSTDGDYDDYIIRITSSAVPEPGTWALLIAGFGMIGYSLRSRRRVVGLAC